MRLRPPRPSPTVWFLIAVGLMEIILVFLLLNDAGALA